MPTLKQRQLLTELQAPMDALYSSLTQAKQAELHEQLEAFKLSIQQLTDSLARHSEKLAYNYNYGDYNTRLSQPDSVITSTFERLLDEDPEIKTLYEKILSHFPASLHSQSTKKIYTDYFEDVVYEYIDPKELQQEETVNLYNNNI